MRKALLLAVLVLKFDPGHDAPSYGTDVFVPPGSAQYLIVGDGWVRFAHREKDGAAYEAIFLHKPEVTILKKRIGVRWPIRMLGKLERGRETLDFAREPSDDGSYAGTLQRQLVDREAFLSGRGSVDRLPLLKPVSRSVRLVPETDEEALKALTPLSGPVINSKP